MTARGGVALSPAKHDRVVCNILHAYAELTTFADKVRKKP